MADVKISDLSAASSATGAMELEVNDAGSSKKITVDQLQEKVTGSTNGLIARTGANTTAARTITAGASGKIIVSNGDGVAGNPTVELDGNAVVTKGTKSAIDALASGGSLEAGQLLYLTDEQTFVGATGTGEYKPVGKNYKLITLLSSRALLASDDGAILSTGVLGREITLPASAPGGPPVGFSTTLIAGVMGAVLKVEANQTLNGESVGGSPRYVVLPSFSRTEIFRESGGGFGAWNAHCNKEFGTSPEVVHASKYNRANGTETLFGSPFIVAPGDLLLIFVETANEPVATPTGFSIAPGSPQLTGTAGGTSATGLQVFYKIAVGGDTTTITSAGDHFVAIAVQIRNADTTNPIDVAAGSVAAAASTAVSLPSVTPTRNFALIIGAVANATDTTAAQLSGVTNGALGSLGILMNYNTANGNGGGVSLVTGIKSAPGATGATTGTLATSSVQARWTGAINAK